MGFFENDDVGKLVLRLMLAIIILFHGIGKVLHPAALGFIGHSLSSAGLPQFIAYGVYLGEVVGPLMILVGYKARWGGVLVVINMLFAIGLVHSHQLISVTDHGTLAIELDYFFLFSGLAVAFLGSGRYAIQRDS